MKKLFFLCLCLLVGGAFEVQAAGFVFQRNGQPYRWSTSSTIDYLVDIDEPALGSTSHAQARQWVIDAFSAWEGVAIGDLTFNANPGPTAEDINLANHETYFTMDLSTGAPSGKTSDSIIVFDANGDILAHYFGEVNRNAVLGWAGPSVVTDATNTIEAGIAVLNGNGTNAPQIQRTMIHEFGHTLNMAHVQVHTDKAFNSSPADDYLVPTMFPFIMETLDQVHALTQDDQFSLGYLYPSSQYAQRGRINGKLLRGTGEGVAGMNVVCTNPSNPLTDTVSWVSDLHLAGNGEYVCGNLNSGSYSVRIEPLLFFVTGFVDPYPPVEVSEFFNGAAESFDPEIDDITEDEPVSVSLGTSVTDVDIIMNGNGQLISGQPTSGLIGHGLDYRISEFEYRISVPESADTVTFEISTNSGADLDINGKCGEGFSMLYVYNFGFPEPVDQASFGTTGTTGNESITLRRDGAPELDTCTYHILLTNFGPDATPDFEITATIEGANPQLRIEKGGAETVSEGTGELLVANPQFIAVDDIYRVRSMVFTDKGNSSLSGVTEATLYEDLDESGTVTEGDSVIASATDIDSGTRRITFEGLDEFFSPESERNFLLTYGVASATAGWPLLGIFLLLGVVVGVRRKHYHALVLLMGLTVFLSCGSTPGYHPLIESKDDIEVNGQTFGSNFTLSVEGTTPKSVKDFFK